MMVSLLILALLSVSSALAQSDNQAAAWGQCDGDHWTGPTTCGSDYVCRTAYSRCIPVADDVSSAGSASPTASCAAAATVTVTVYASATASASRIRTFSHPHSRPALTPSASVPDIPTPSSDPTTSGQSSGSSDAPTSSVPDSGPTSNASPSATETAETTTETAEATTETTGTAESDTTGTADSSSDALTPTVSDNVPISSPSPSTSESAVATESGATESNTPTPEPTASATPSEVGPDGLHALARSAGMYFGTEVDNPDLLQEDIVKALANVNDFGQITPGNTMKWDHIEAERGVLTFEAADEITDMAKKNGQMIRGHNCLWYIDMPQWIIDGNFTGPEMKDIITEHCGQLIGHWKGEIYGWDVINEPIDTDGTHRDTPFNKNLGPSYINIALDAAHAADPAAKLYINDYDIYDPSEPKHAGLLQLAKDLLAAGAPLHGIGIQSHFVVGQFPPKFKESMEAFTALGLEVAITELDIRMPDPPTQENLDQQRKDYESTISVCKEVKGCVGVTVWGFTDRTSWIPAFVQGFGSATPWDKSLDKKPAYNGIEAGFSS